MPHDGLSADVHPAEQVLPLAVNHSQDAPLGLAPIYDVVGAQRDLRLQEALKAAQGLRGMAVGAQCAAAAPEPSLRCPPALTRRHAFHWACLIKGYKACL